MKKTCNYCRAYFDPNCALGFAQEELSEGEMEKYNTWPYGLVEARYYIKMKPAEICTAPRTWKELYAAGWGK